MLHRSPSFLGTAFNQECLGVHTCVQIAKGFQSKKRPRTTADIFIVSSLPRRHKGAPRTTNATRCVGCTLGLANVDFERRPLELQGAHWREARPNTNYDNETFVKPRWHPRTLRARTAELPSNNCGAPKLPCDQPRVR